MAVHNERSDLASKPSNLSPFQIGAIRVEPARNALLRDGTEYSLEPRIMDVLCVLAAEAGEVVTRETLIERLWDTEYGADESLTRAISIIRKVVRQAGETEPYIETIKKRGYRLLQPVSGVVTESERLGSGRPVTRSRWAALVVAAAVIVVFVSATYLLSGRYALHEVAEAPTDSASADQIPIAVLPFRPLSNNEADAWFGDGLTEELINALAGVDELAVVSRTSSFSYKEIDKDIREIASQLDVDYVVEGSVRTADGKIRVAAQLIRASDGYHVWSGVLENETDATFELQDEIVREISRALQLRLQLGYGEDVAPHGTRDPDAVERYYQGLHVWGNRMRKDGAAREAYDLLRSAVEIDPDFAEAWSALAVIGVSWSSGPLAREKEEFITRVKNDVERASTLRPDDYRLHAALVIWFTRVEIDLEQALSHLDKAEATAPTADRVLFAKAQYSWLVGDTKSALESYRRAIRLDPLNDVARLGLAVMLAALGETNAAFEFFDSCQQSNCLQEGFVAYGATAAIHSDDQLIRERWSSIYDRFEAMLESLPDSSKPPVVKINPAYYSIGFRQPDSEQMTEMVRELFAQELITDHIGIWGPSLAQVLPRETVMDTLVLAYERGDLFSAPFSLSPFYGRNPFPDWVLEHPRYHALWARPELTRLAEIRQQNGWTDGLPR